MTEADITQLMVMNRHAFIGWLTASVVFTLGIFFLAYVIRGASTLTRGAVFGVFVLGALSFFMTLTVTNEGFLRLVQDLNAVAPMTQFSKGTLEALGTDAPAFPAWARLANPVILLFNLLIGFQLLLRERWGQ